MKGGENVSLGHQYQNEIDDLRAELNEVKDTLIAKERELADAKAALEQSLKRLGAVEMKAHLQTIDERDAAEETLSQAYYLITGNSPEWSNLFGHEQALQDIDDAQRCFRSEIKQIELLRDEDFKRAERAEAKLAQLESQLQTIELAAVVAREQLAAAAALEQAANIVKVYVGTLGDGPRGVILGRIRALIPPEGADLLRRDYIPRKEVVAKINKLLCIESNVDLERWEQLELAIAQRERIARLEGMLEVANKLGHNWYGKVSYPCECRDCEFQRKIECELAQTVHQVTVERQEDR